MNLELLKHAKCYIEKMANGINPLTDEKIPDNELINNVRISRCLFYVNDILGEVLENSGIMNKKNKKLPFAITKDILNKFEYSQSPIPVSHIAKKINELNSNTNMTKLRGTNIANWLVNIGLLKESQINGKNYKIPTKAGKDMGLFIETRLGYTGEYYIVQYPKQMQEFIIDNFNTLLDFLNK